MTEEIGNLDVEEVAENLDTGQVEGESTGEGDEEPKEIEPWMAEESEEDGGENSEPAKPFKRLKAKKKLMGQISERDEEIAALKAEMEKLKNPSQNRIQPGPAEAPTVPLERDFETDDEYRAAMDKYQRDLFAAQYDLRSRQQQQVDAGQSALNEIKTAVDGHYDRAAELIESSGISSEVYQNADATVRQAADAIKPGSGDDVINHVISLVGDGSEKVIYYLGRNKSALNEFQSLLAGDPTGFKAAIFLGQQKERLTNPQKRTTQAPAPASQANGDTNTNANGAALKRRYDAASKKGSPQEMYNIRKQARAAGIDVKSW